MKTLIVALLFPVLLKSCEGVPDKSGTPPLTPIGSGTGDNTRGTGTNGTTDAPIDGGLSILLVAGAAYGAKRYRDSRQKGKE